jgi:Abnormal spindle-like microcephaly-assoc'd, ASPM-SPD-2-Hydin/Beta-propeller repeat
MKPAFIILFAVLLLVPSHTGLSREETAPSRETVTLPGLQLNSQGLPGVPPNPGKGDAKTVTLLDNLPLYFVENKGQVDNRVKYYAKIRNGKVYFTGEEIVYQFFLGNREKDSQQNNPFPIESKTPAGKKSAGEASALREETIRLSFVGANADARLEGREEQEAKFSYFRGSDPQKWVSGAPSFQKVVCRDLYPGVDLIVSGREGRMKGEYVVRAGGDPSAIRLKYDGARALSVNKKGQLEIQTPTGMLIEDVPLSHQTIDGKKRDVEARYELAADGVVQFRVGAYRKRADLIIDPLTYSTFLGGSNHDYSRKIIVDGSRNAYLLGYTVSADFPTTSGAYDTSHNGTFDVFITKLNSSGNALLYSTFLGGTGNEGASGLATDVSGNAYLTGNTDSSDFPTTAGAYDTSKNGTLYSDAFVTKLNSTGSVLLYSTFLGGTDNETVRGLAADVSGNTYITGYTTSSDFPTTPGTYDTSYNGSSDGFVTKLNSSGSALLYSTFLGGTGNDGPDALAIDGGGNAYVTGNSGSLDFPTTAGAYDTSHNGGYDAFIAKLNSSGSALLYSTFLGGTVNDYGYGIAIDGNGNAYVGGASYSIDFPTTSGAFDTTFNGNEDAFVTKLNSTGSALLYSTFLGGTGNESSLGMTIDGSGNTYVVGFTSSSEFPTTSGAFDTSFNGSEDGFVTKLNPSGSALLYSTFLGGTGADQARGIAVDGNRDAYVIGYTTSSDFPVTSGAYDSDQNGGNDVFITKLPTSTPDIRQPIAAISFGDVLIGTSSSQTTTIYNDGDGPLTVNSVTPVSGSGNFAYEDPILPFTVAAGGSQAVTIKFTPSSAGAKSAVFNVNSDDFDEPDVTFDVSGTGILAVESVSAPSTLAGPSSGYLNTSYTFTTGGAVSSFGHDVQYFFDFGDGTNSGWLSVGTLFAQKSWSVANTYTVKTKARCATHTTLESPWSASLYVSISAAEYGNSPSRYQVIPECIWAVATGGGTWLSEVQITDITGGSVVAVYFNYGGGGNRRGPFTLWTGPAANYNVKYANILSTIDGLDGGAFTYYGRVGAVEFSTQDASHKIMVTARTLNGNYSKTFPGLNLTDSNTANTSRRMVLQNFVNNSTYRSSCGFFNPTADSVTMELRLIAENGDTIGSAFTKTLVGHDFQSFSPFNQAGVPYPSYAYDNVVLWITPTSGSGKVMVFGASANNTSNDPAAHIGVQYQ